MEGIVFQKSETTLPYWSLLPLEEQIINILPTIEDEPMTARDIANELCVTKTEVNSVLYRLEGSKTKQEKEELPAPYWYLINE